jgi:hypothetical protein
MNGDLDESEVWRWTEPGQRCLLSHAVQGYTRRALQGGEGRAQQTSLVCTLFLESLEYGRDCGSQEGQAGCCFHQ